MRWRYLFREGEPEKMIRVLEEKDMDVVCNIVNENWKNVYSGYMNPSLLNEEGCAERTRRLKLDFTTSRLLEYVWEEQNRVLAMLSLGDAADADMAGAFEIFRLYVDSQFQGKGIGGRLINFAEEKAEEQGYKEIAIWALKSNEHAVSFYQKRGYRADREKCLNEPYFTMGIRLKKHL